MSENKKLRWGILGAARVNERLMPAIIDAANAELVAIGSRRPGAAAETLAKYAPHQQGVRAYDSPEAILDDDEIEAVYLPMANREHAEWALRAIEKGKHVLCEKPMALKISDIEAIESAALRQNVTVMEGFMYRFHPQHARALDILRSGEIGEIRTVRSSFSFMMKPGRMYRIADSIDQGGGAMWDIGCYAIHSLRLIFDGMPESVTAVSKYIESGADTACSGVLDFGDGKYAHFDFSFERARRCEYEVIGTKGGLKCHGVWQNPGDIPVISWWVEGGRQVEEVLPVADHFRLEIEHFSDCVLNGKEPALSLEDAKTNCRIIVGALQSAEDGRLIRF